MGNDAVCILCERCSSAPPTEPAHVRSSKAAARASAAVALAAVVGMLLQLVRIARPYIAFHAVPNAPPALRSSAHASAPNACVCLCAVECRMDRQGPTATSVIGVVQVILRVASAVLFPSDVFVACLTGVHPLLRSLSLHLGGPKHTPALTVAHGVGSVSVCMRARA
jgi:hypothetical protein